MKKRMKIYGPRDINKRGGLVAFTVGGPSTSHSTVSSDRIGSGYFVHAHDVAQILDSEGVAVRSGHHCTMVMHKALGISGTTRASFGVYNTEEDIDKLIEGLRKVRRVFNG